jgi:hypothetical protein
MWTVAKQNTTDGSWHGKTPKPNAPDSLALPGIKMDSIAKGSSPSKALRKVILHPAGALPGTGQGWQLNKSAGETVSR